MATPNSVVSKVLSPGPQQTLAQQTAQAEAKAYEGVSVPGTSDGRPVGIPTQPNPNSPEYAGFPGQPDQPRSNAEWGGPPPSNAEWGGPPASNAEWSGPPASNAEWGGPPVEPVSRSDLEFAGPPSESVPLPRSRPTLASGESGTSPVTAPRGPVSWRDDAMVRYANPADEHDSEYNVQSVSPKADAPAEVVKTAGRNVLLGAKSLVTSGPIAEGVAAGKAAVDQAGKAVGRVKGWWKSNVQRLDHPALVSAAGETGRPDWSRQGQVAPDTGGSRSYGVFGLNTLGGSKSSAAQFTRQYGKALGLTATPGTEAFARQWKAAAQNNPEGLKQAQLAWWDKNVGAKVSSSLVGLGVPRGVSEHPAVKAYFADRMVQYGPALDKYSTRVRKAWAASGGSPDKFMRNMNGQDAANLKRDFRSYLRGHPNNEGGLANRISKRYHLSKAVQATPQGNPGLDTLEGVVEAGKQIGDQFDFKGMRQSSNVEDGRGEYGRDVLRVMMAGAKPETFDDLLTKYGIAGVANIIGDLSIEGQKVPKEFVKRHRDYIRKHPEVLNKDNPAYSAWNAKLSEAYDNRSVDESNPLARALGIRDIGK